MTKDDQEFYVKGKEYWENISPTVDGMLGGFSHISNIDVQASERFLKSLFKAGQKVGGDRALDCGAGIGRVTKLFLLKYYRVVDLVEQNQKFLDRAKEYIGTESHRVDRLICSGLQDFVPDSNTYDMIWCQWVTGHLTDADFVTFLKACKSGLKEGGFIVVKDNLAGEMDVVYDNRDSSVTRPRSLLLRLFAEADLKLVVERKQSKFPKGLFEVKMFALQ